MRIFTSKKYLYLLSATSFLSIVCAAHCLASPLNPSPKTMYVKASQSDLRGKTIHLVSGTGFFINNNTIITNEHVAHDCVEIKIRGAIEDSSAKIIGANKKKDLALIRTSVNSSAVAPLRGDAPIKIGEEVNVMGYPLERGIKGTYLIKKATVTNNLDVYDGVERIQFTDSAQKGNSGGPLLDTSGTVIGVIVGNMSFYPAGSDTRDATPIKTSSVAITLKDLKNFLNTYGIFFRTDNINYKYSDSYMENKAKEYIVNVQCIKKDPDEAE